MGFISAPAIVVTGAGTRTLGILREMEVQAERPVVAADAILYRAVAQQPGISLGPAMVALLPRFREPASRHMV